MRGAAAMRSWLDLFQRHLGWMVGVGGLMAWVALLYYMFHDVL